MSDLELSLANLRARQEANAQKSLLQQLQLPLWAETQRGVPNSLLAELQATALVSWHKSNVGLRWPSKRIAAFHRLPIRSVSAARCALRCAPMAARSLRHLIRDTTLEDVAHGHHRAAHRLGTARVAARLLFDHALDHAGREGHAGRLDHLQVVRSEQMAVG